MTQIHRDLEKKKKKTQETVQKIASDLEKLTRQLNSCKLASEGELGRFKGEITSEVTNRLSVMEQKVTQLFREIEKIYISIADNAEHFVTCW